MGHKIKGFWSLDWFEISYLKYWLNMDLLIPTSPMIYAAQVSNSTCLEIHVPGDTFAIWYNIFCFSICYSKVMVMVIEWKLHTDPTLHLLELLILQSIYLLSTPNGSIKLYEFIIISGLVTLILAQIPSFHSLRHINLISLILALAFSACATAGAIHIGK